MISNIKTKAIMPLITDNSGFLKRILNLNPLYNVRQTDNRIVSINNQDKGIKDLSKSDKALKDSVTIRIRSNWERKL
jgi:hypothetical protein